MITIAQDIEPRRWTTLPLDMKVFGFGYGYTFGDILFDPLLEVEDTEVKSDTIVGVYVQSFSLAGKAARFDVLIPKLNVHWDGLLNGEQTSVDRNGFADPRFRLSVNLLGPPATDGATLRKYYQSNPVNTTLGVAVAVTLPIGEYFEDKLLNLGQNRYSIRPQIGVVHNRGPWSFELTGSVFYYTENDEFYNDNKRTQKPLFTTQTHLIYSFGQGVWASLSTGYGYGGESSINNIDKLDTRKVLINGLSYGFPINKTQSIKLSYIKSKTHTNIGTNLNTLVVAWTVRL